MGSRRQESLFRKVYNETRDRGRKPIVEPLRDVVKVSDDPLDYRFDAPDGVDGVETAAFIRSVWDTHKRYTSIQLSNATHAKGEPWTVIKDRVGHLNQKPVIPNDLIGRIFKRKLDDAAETAPSAAR
jgi:uncharacterized phage-associated protein